MGTTEEKKKKWVEVDYLDSLKCKLLAATSKVLSTETQAYFIMAEFLSMITDLIEGELATRCLICVISLSHLSGYNKTL